MQISPMGQPGWIQPTTSAGATRSEQPGQTERFQAGQAGATSMVGMAKTLFKESSAERWRITLPFAPKNDPTTDSQGQIYMSSQDGRVQKLDLETGKPVWQQDDGRYLTDPSFTPEGNLIVVNDMRHVQVRDPNTGDLIHQVDLDHPSLSPPASGPNNLLVLLGGDGLTDTNWSIYAVDPKIKPKKNLMRTLLAPLTLIPHHGTVQQWELKVNDKPGVLPIPMTPKGDLHRLVNLPNGSIAATTGDQEVVALDPQTGKQTWRKEIPGRGLYDPVPLGQDQVLLAGPQTLHFLDARTGEPVKNHPVDGVLFSQPSADKQGNVFFFTGLDQLNVVRTDGKTWTQRGDFETGIRPVQDDQNHLFVVKKGALYVLNAETGEESYRLACKGAISSPPALLADGSLAVKVRTGHGLDEELVCLQSPSQAASREDDSAPAVAESAAWVRIGGVQVKRRQT